MEMVFTLGREDYHGQVSSFLYIFFACFQEFSCLFLRLYIYSTVILWTETEKPAGRPSRVLSLSCFYKVDLNFSFWCMRQSRNPAEHLDILKFHRKVLHSLLSHDSFTYRHTFLLSSWSKAQMPLAEYFKMKLITICWPIVSFVTLLVWN